MILHERDSLWSYAQQESIGIVLKTRAAGAESMISGASSCGRLRPQFRAHSAVFHVGLKVEAEFLANVQHVAVLGKND